MSGEMSPIDAAAKAAFESYTMYEHGYRGTYSDLHDTAKMLWRDLAEDAVHAYNNRLTELRRERQ